MQKMTFFFVFEGLLYRDIRYKDNNLKLRSRSQNVHFNTRCDHAEEYQRQPY